MAQLSELQKQIGAWAKRKGWEFDAKDIPEKLCLMHSEVSEALEEYRKGLAPHLVYYSEDGKPEGIPVEIADLTIRILHFCDNFNIDLSLLIEQKMAYNETRPYRHGKTV